MKTLPTQRAIRAIKPSAGLRDEYEVRLLKLVNAISDDLSKSIKKAYDKNEPLIAQDALPSDVFRILFNRKRKEWMDRFEKESKDFAEWFAQSEFKHFVRANCSALKSAGLNGLAVGFTTGNVTKDVLKAIVNENVTLIRSIGEQYLNDVEGLVMRSVTRGGDLKTLAENLTKRYGITKRRAVFIARDQNQKATQSLAMANAKESGLTRGKWIHVPGRKSSRESHKRMNGKIFDLDKGLYDSEVKQWVKPGELPGCNCQFQLIYDTDLWKS